MANLKDIKSRIQSVESTKKITRAMKMVAAAKVKRSETAVKASRPYTKELIGMFQKLLNSVSSYSSDTLKIKYAIDDAFNPEYGSARPGPNASTNPNSAKFTPFSKYSHGCARGKQ